MHFLPDIGRYNGKTRFLAILTGKNSVSLQLRFVLIPQFKNRKGTRYVRRNEVIRLQV